MKKYLLLALTLAALPMHAMHQCTYCTKHQKTVLVGINKMEHCPLSESHTVNFMDVCDDQVVTLFMAKNKKEDVVDCALSVHHQSYVDKHAIEKMKLQLESLNIDPAVTILSMPLNFLTTKYPLTDYMFAEQAIHENFNNVIEAPYDITKIKSPYLHFGPVTVEVNTENAIELALHIRPRGRITVYRQGKNVDVQITGHDPLKYMVIGALLAKRSKE